MKKLFEKIAMMIKAHQDLKRNSQRVKEELEKEAALEKAQQYIDQDKKRIQQILERMKKNYCAFAPPQRNFEDHKCFSCAHFSPPSLDESPKITKSFLPSHEWIPEVDNYRPPYCKLWRE